MADLEHQQGYSARGVARTWQIDRAFVLEEIHAGNLPAYRRGKRRWILFRGDVEDWIKRHAVKATDHATARVDQVMAREAKAAGS